YAAGKEIGTDNYHFTRANNNVGTFISSTRIIDTVTFEGRNYNILIELDANGLPMGKPFGIEAPAVPASKPEEKPETEKPVAQSTEPQAPIRLAFAGALDGSIPLFNANLTQVATVTVTDTRLAQAAVAGEHDIRGPPASGDIRVIKTPSGFAFSIVSPQEAGQQALFFGLGSAEQVTGNRQVSAYHTNFMPVVSSIREVAPYLRANGHNTYKIYLPPNNPTSSDMVQLKQLIGDVYKQTGMRAVVLSFAGQYAADERGNFYLGNPTPAHLEAVKGMVRSLALEMKDLGPAVAFVQLANENDYYVPGAGTSSFGGNAWDSIKMSADNYYKFMNDLAAEYKGIDAGHPVFLGHGGMSERIAKTMQPYMSNFDGIALNLYPNWDEGRPAKRVQSADELDSAYGYHIRLAAQFGKPVVIGEYGESSYGKLGEAGQAEFCRNATQALSRYMAGNQEARFADYPKVLVGMYWHERVGETWKDREIHPSESGLGLFGQDQAPKLALRAISEGYQAINQQLTAVGQVEQVRTREAVEPELPKPQAPVQDMTVPVVPVEDNRGASTVAAQVPTVGAVRESIRYWGEYTIPGHPELMLVEIVRDGSSEFYSADRNTYEIDANTLLANNNVVAEISRTSDNAALLVVHAVPTEAGKQWGMSERYFGVEKLGGRESVRFDLLTNEAEVIRSKEISEIYKFDPASWNLSATPAATLRNIGEVAAVNGVIRLRYDNNGRPEQAFVLDAQGKVLFETLLKPVARMTYINEEGKPVRVTQEAITINEATGEINYANVGEVSVVTSGRGETVGSMHLPKDTLVLRQAGKIVAIVNYGLPVSAMLEDATANWGYVIIPGGGWKIYRTQKELPGEGRFFKHPDGRVSDLQYGKDSTVVYGDKAAALPEPMGEGKSGKNSSDLGIVTYNFKGERRTDNFKGERRTDACMYNGKPLWRIVGDLMTFFDPSESKYEKPVLTINIKTGEDIYRYDVQVSKNIVIVKVISAENDKEIMTEAYRIGQSSPLWRQIANERTYFNTKNSFETPVYSIDMSGISGMTVIINGKPVNNVTKFYHVERLDNNINVSIIDLCAVNPEIHQASIRTETRDANGVTKEAREGMIRLASKKQYNADDLFNGQIKYNTFYTVKNNAAGIEIGRRVYEFNDDTRAFELKFVATNYRREKDGTVTQDIYKAKQGARGKIVIGDFVSQDTFDKLSRLVARKTDILKPYTVLTAQQDKLTARTTQALSVQAQARLKEIEARLAQLTPEGGAKVLTVPSKVAASSDKILVDNKPYQIRAVTWSPARAGDSRTDMDFGNTYQQDIALMRQLGINTVRTYSAIESKEVLDALAANGIRVIMGIPYFDDTNAPVADIKTGSYKGYIQKFKNHPAILMWEFGNEYNYLFKSNPEWIPGGVDGWHRVLEDTAKVTHTLDTQHVVSTAHGELPAKDVLSRCPSVDVWGMNVYRGNSLTNLFVEWKARSNKPMYISETRTNDDAQLWQAVNNAKDVCNGVAYMEFSNEPWKGSKVLGNVPYAEDELGFVNADRQPKPAFETLRQLWGAKIAPETSKELDDLNREKAKLLSESAQGPDNVAPYTVLSGLQEKIDTHTQRIDYLSSTKVVSYAVTTDQLQNTYETRTLRTAHDKSGRIVPVTDNQGRYVYDVNQLGKSSIEYYYPYDPTGLPSKVKIGVKTYNYFNGRMVFKLVNSGTELEMTTKGVTEKPAVLSEKEKEKALLRINLGQLYGYALPHMDPFEI
ncbi:MAG: glycoside hydrolase family 2 TIM barrel-domain containing protein, partial [Candidatus Omnitrophota bacterium]